jgi:hypothetical protein
MTLNKEQKRSQLFKKFYLSRKLPMQIRKITVKRHFFAGL